MTHQPPPSSSSGDAASAIDRLRQHLRGLAGKWRQEAMRHRVKPPGGRVTLAELNAAYLDISEERRKCASELEHEVNGWEAAPGSAIPSPDKAVDFAWPQDVAGLTAMAAEWGGIEGDDLLAADVLIHKLGLALTQMQQERDERTRELVTAQAHFDMSRQDFHAMKASRDKLAGSAIPPPPICSGCQESMHRVDYHCPACGTFTEPDPAGSAIPPPQERRWLLCPHCLHRWDALGIRVEGWASCPSCQGSFSFVKPRPILDPESAKREALSEAGSAIPPPEQLQRERDEAIEWIQERRCHNSAFYDGYRAALAGNAKAPPFVLGRLNSSWLDGFDDGTRDVAARDALVARAEAAEAELAALKAGSAIPPEGIPLEAIAQVIATWREQANQSSLEATRIYNTVKVHTDAQERCYARADVWKKCADDLAALLSASPQDDKPTPEGDPA